ncbi:MAG: GNAT family N-acetyltransferase [Clostridia bacterium]|nr:GNAT family N-acetyltransferase [Clostridia bacterium]
MTIRKMTIADYEKVYALWLSCRGMGLNDVDDSREGIGRFLQRNPDTCFVAIDGGKTVGAIMAGHDGRRGFIYHTAVSPAMRRRGVGSALVQTAIAALKAQGITKAALVVFQRNQAGNAFWEKMGFAAREDLAYRNLSIHEIKRRDT